MNDTISFFQTHSIHFILNTGSIKKVQATPEIVDPELLLRLSQFQLIDPLQPTLFTSLRGGMTNQVYLLTQGEVRLTVKMYDVCTDGENPLYPNLPQAEISALSELAGSGFTPQLLNYWDVTSTDSGAEQAILVYEYLDGDIWQSNTAQVAHLLSTLHNTELTNVPSWLRKLPQSASEVCLHADKILQQASRLDTAKLKKLRPTNPSDNKVPVESFIHGDCWGGNFIQSDNGLRLIDWQCPGAGDPVEDIANFLSPGMMSFCRREPLSNAEREAFFEAYVDKSVIKRYQRDKASWHWRLACYYLYRQQTLQGVLPELSLGYKAALALEIEYLREMS